MNSSDSQPKLPIWVFVLTDLALIGAAAFVASESAKPLSPSTTLWIVLCVIAGAIVGLVPMIVHFERQKNEMLDERQRALEALARTVSTSAEQISIATNGLNEIGEIAQKNLRHAEQLPHKLQEKMADFQAQLANANEAETEELERELLALRTSESERLDSVSQRIAKSAADWAKLEAATHQHLNAANEAVAKLAMGTANAIGKAQAAAEQALAHARVEAARSLGEASGQAARAVETAKTAALAEIESRLTATSRATADRVAADLQARVADALRALDEKIAKLEAVAARVSAPPIAPTPAVTAPVAVEPPAPEPPPTAPAAAEPAAPVEPAPAAEHAPAPKRVRKPRREEPAHEVAAPAAAEPASSSVEPVASAEPAALPPAEPPPVLVEKIPEVTPIAPHTTEPFATESANGSDPARSGAPATHETDAAAPAPAPNPRKRAAKKAVGEDEPGLGLELEDTGPRVTSGLTERVLTSDGATRLVVTAYIGIGNKLYIRGEGAGLSWEKGVPLQFVSIGKWRWETNDANAPVRFKLYKNDEIECAGLGEQTLDPGHQQDVMAAF